jgi:hypothetical protein
VALIQFEETDVQEAIYLYLEVQKGSGPVKIAHYYCLLFGKKLEGLVLSGRSCDFKSEFIKVKSILTIRILGFTEGKNMDRLGLLVEFIFIQVPPERKFLVIQL